jgi:hypothetical protein
LETSFGKDLYRKIFGAEKRTVCLYLYAKKIARLAAPFPPSRPYRPTGSSRITPKWPSSILDGIGLRSIAVCCLWLPPNTPGFAAARNGLIRYL